MLFYVHNFSEHCFMLLKIFVVMGVTYFFEFIGFILSWIYGTEHVWKYLVVNNIINALQGVLIFVVLICKRPILHKLSTKWNSFHPFSLPKKMSSVKSVSNNTRNTERTSVGDKIDFNHPTDVVTLCGISGKYSTTSIVSNSTTVTNVAST